MMAEAAKCEETPVEMCNSADDAAKLRTDGRDLTTLALDCQALAEPMHDNRYWIGGPWGQDGPIYVWDSQASAICNPRTGDAKGDQWPWGFAYPEDAARFADALNNGRATPAIRSETMKPEYLREGAPFAMAHSVEEVGEVLVAFGNFLQAAGKTQRWGLDSINPELPPERQETNRDWLKREMGDLRGALDRLDVAIDREPDNGEG